MNRILMKRILLPLLSVGLTGIIMIIPARTFAEPLPSGTKFQHNFVIPAEFLNSADSSAVIASTEDLPSPVAATEYKPPEEPASVTIPQSTEQVTEQVGQQVGEQAGEHTTGPTPAPSSSVVVRFTQTILPPNCYDVAASNGQTTDYIAVYDCTIQRY